MALDYLVSVPSSFRSDGTWLMPRSSKFKWLYPEIAWRGSFYLIDKTVFVWTNTVGRLFWVLFSHQKHSRSFIEFGVIQRDLSVQLGAFLSFSVKKRFSSPSPLPQCLHCISTCNLRSTCVKWILLAAPVFIGSFRGMSFCDVDETLIIIQPLKTNQWSSSILFIWHMLDLCFYFDAYR